MSALKKRSELNPTVTVSMARDMIGYKELKSVYDLGKRGILKPCVISNDGWRRWEPGEKTDYKSRWMFIRSEVEQYIVERAEQGKSLLVPAPPKNDTPYDQKTVKLVLSVANSLLDERGGVHLSQITEQLKDYDAWEDKRKKKAIIRSILFEANIKCYEYTPAQLEVVLKEVELLKDENGAVSRSGLFEVLHTKYGMSNQSQSLYNKMKSILDDYSIPYISNRKDTTNAKAIMNMIKR